MENEISPGVKVRVRVRDGAPTKQPPAPQQDPTPPQGEADCHVARSSLLAMTGNFESPAPISAAQNVENGAPTKLPCHSETSPQTGRGNPHPLAPHYDHTPPQGETDCHVARSSLLAMTGNFESPAPISDTQKNVENGAPTNQSCHSETSSQTGRGNPSPSPPALRAHFERLCAEAEALHRAEPGFDLNAALHDPRFLRLTAPGVGVPVADAWYALHRDEYAEDLRRESMERAAAAVAAGRLRPREGGRTSGGELMGTDPRHMSPAQRAELKERIKRGEKVYPGV